MGWLVVVFSFLMGISATGAQPKKAWTVLVYVAGDEAEIDRYSRVPLRKMEQVGSTDDRWIVAHADFHFDESGEMAVEEPAVRYEIGHFPGPVIPGDYSTLKIASPIVWRGDKESDSASGQELAHFVRWGMANYPADHTALFLLGHSWGWRGVMQDFRPGFAAHSTAPERNFSLMPINDLETSLSESLAESLGGAKLDWVVMDTCRGGVMEIAYSLRNLAHYLTAASTQMSYMSFDYEAMLRHSWGDLETLIRLSGRDLLRSFARGGSQVADEGDLSAIGLFGIRLQALDPLWKFVGDLKGLENFGKIFLEEENSVHQDLMGNIDLTELLEGVARYGVGSDLPQRASELLGQLGVTEAPDGLFHSLRVPASAKYLRVWVQGDEVAEKSVALTAAQEQFKYLNPRLKAIEGAQWTVYDRYGERFFAVKMKDIAALPAAGEPLSLRPFIAGSLWARVEWLGPRGEILSSERITQAATYYIQESFAKTSAYVFQGHTSGAARNRGLALQIQTELDPVLLENYALVNGAWVFGPLAYADTRFSKMLNWGALIFQKYFK